MVAIEMAAKEIKYDTLKLKLNADNNPPNSGRIICNIGI